MSERPAKRPRTEPAKRPRTDHTLVNLWEREGLLNRFGLHKKLRKHKGCVNTVSFNADGDILVSGSDDRQVILWDWETGAVKFSFDSGHRNNIFQAKFMPFSDDRSIVTSAADGQVHKLAVESGSPFSFYTCGEDGVVKHFDLRTRVATNLFTCKEAKYNLVVYLNAIALDPRNPGLFAVGGMDGYARVYDIRSYRSEGWYNFAQPVDHFCPRHLIENGHEGITGLAFSDQSELLVSYCDELIYLFSPDMGLGPNPLTETEEKRPPQVYKGHKNCETVKGVNFYGPKCEFVVSGSDCGQIFIWRKKDGELLREMEADRRVVNCVESHPHLPLMCSSGIESDIKIWTPGGTEELMAPGNMEEASESGNPVRFLFHDGEGDDHVFIVDDDDDSDDEDSDESSDDDDSAEEEENGEIDVEIIKDDDDDDDDDDGGGGDGDGWG